MEREAAVSCEAPGKDVVEASFDEALEAYGSRKFWVSFFVRPCCPPPPSETAKKQLENQRELVRAREDFTAEQKEQLIALIDDGEAWYRSTPYWNKKH